MNFLIFITLISIIRYLISGLFTFSTFNDPKKRPFKITIMQSVLYSICLALFKIFVIDSPIITFISAIVIFGCLLLKNEIKIWKTMFTYSLFMACMLEYTHFIIFESVSSIWKYFEFPEAKYANYTSLLFFRAAVLLLYVLTILLIYKFDRINLKSVCKLANHIVFPIFFIIALGVIVFLKYHIKYTISNEFHGVLSVIFVSFIILTLTFIFSSKTFVEAIEDFYKKKINPAIEEAKLKKGMGYVGLIFESQKLNSQVKYFRHELYIIGMDTEDKKARQLVHCDVLVNQEEHPEQVNIISDIYSHTGEILGLQPKSVEMNISNLLKNHWSSRDPKILKAIEQNYHGPISEKNGAPTPKEFILYLVNKYREDHKVEINTEKINISFIKKYFIDT